MNTTARRPAILAQMIAETTARIQADKLIAYRPELYTAEIVEVATNQLRANAVLLEELYCEQAEAGAPFLRMDEDGMAVYRNNGII